MCFRMNEVKLYDSTLLTHDEQNCKKVTVNVK